MDIINILGIKAFMECILAENIDFTYENNLMKFNHESYIDINEYKEKINRIDMQLNQPNDVLPKESQEYKNLFNAKELLLNLVHKLENK